jgi:hypothetical protein
VVGRVTIIKTLGLSKLLYNASVLYVPDFVIKEVNSEIFRFFWNYKREKIKRKSLIGNRDEGGLNMVDFEAQVHALKVKWVNRLLTDTGAWSHVASSFLENVCSDLKLLFNSNITHSKYLPQACAILLHPNAKHVVQ